MADNYLEKKMEEHRLRAANGPRKTASRSASASKVQSGTLMIVYPQLRVVVTGGASGIGAEIVKAFRKIDAKVDFYDIDTKKGGKLAQETGSRFIPCDVRDAASLTSALRRTLTDRGDIDVVVNNVGIGDFKPLESTTATDFDNIINTNLRPIYLITGQLARHRAELPTRNPYGGRVVNIASTRAYMSETGTEGYSATKGAILALTHALMMSLSKYGITVNSISPGWIETGDFESLSPEAHAEHPSLRVGKPADIARVVLFLADPRNSFINGTDIVVDGGMTHKMVYLN